MSPALLAMGILGTTLGVCITLAGIELIVGAFQ